MAFLKVYLIALCIFLLIDFVWLGFVAKNLYKEQIGALMPEQIRWGAAFLTYCIYVAGLVFFAILPGLNEGNWTLALLYGGLFGLVCYATYDLTNLATLKEWPIKIAVYDILWGTFISGITSFFVVVLSRYVPLK